MTEPADLFGWLEDQGDDAALLQCAQTAFGGFTPPSVLGLAVSGGSDSMALLHLMAQAAPHAGWRVQAVTVDHRLRPDAADEAAFVGRVCASLAVPHQVVSWDHGAITGNLMDQARRARYALMAGWAQARGIGTIAVAHTADDQAETFLMGLSRAAGLDGLSGMRHLWQQGDCVFVRPLLHRTRTELRAYLSRHGLEWVDDPTNTDDHYARVKARRALKALKPLGITVERLAGTVGYLAAAQRVLDAAVSDTSRTLIREEAGALWLDAVEYRRLDPELQRRLLLLCLRWLSGADHPPRQTRLVNLDTALLTGRDATVGGCRFRNGGRMVLAVREPKATGGAVPVGTLWDHRWMVEGPPGEVRALGALGLPQVKNWRALCLPRDALLVTPAVWDGDTLLAAPVAGMENGWKARIVAPLHRFPVSH